MSYDYYSAGSDIAGPTAPINGFKENKYFFDITSTYEDYAKVLPKNKIIMGIPFYGRDWAVENGSKIQSRTFPAEDPANYSAINTYAYLKTDKDLKPENCQWDEYALQTWCWYTEARTQTDHQVWLEDNKSLNIKFNFAQNHGFPGVAIWALEFDKNYPDLWTLITSKFTK